MDMEIWEKRIYESLTENKKKFLIFKAVIDQTQIGNSVDIPHEDLGPFALY